MNTPTEKKSIKLFDRLESLSTQIVSYRKILFDFCIIVLMLLLIIVLVVTSFQNKLLVMPVEIPNQLEKAGYTPALFTEKILDRVAFIKNEASSYYQNNDIKLATNDERLEMVNTLVDNTPFEGFKGLINDFVNRNQRKATGKVMPKDDKLQMTFRIDAEFPVVFETGNIDSIIFTTAEYIMQEIDPYRLGAFYFQTRQYQKCLTLVQRLLNDKDSKYKYLAFHIRGNVYIKMGNYYKKNKQDSTHRWLSVDYFNYAKSIFDSAIATNKLKSPWLSYNSMGVLYQDQQKYDTAKSWYRRSMTLNNAGAYAFYNYGNILLDEYGKAKNARYLDSAIFYFKEAIKRNSANIDHYIGLLKSYTMGVKIPEAKEMFFKCLDMDPHNEVIYTLMSNMYLSIKDLEMATAYDDLRENRKNQLFLSNE